DAADDTVSSQPGISVALVAGRVSGALRLALSDSAPGDVSFAGTVDLARLDVTATGMQVGTDAANWSGDVAVTIPDQGPLYEVTGELTTAGTSLQLDNGFSGTVAAARWDGSIANATGQPVPTLTGALSAEDFAVRRDPQGAHLAAVQRIELRELSGSPTQQLRAAALYLSGVDALELETATDGARAVVVDGDVQLGPVIVSAGEQGTRVEVTRAAVEGVAVTIRRLADGRLAGFNHLESTAPSAAPATVPGGEAASSDPGFTLAIDELVVAPGSRISFQDRGVSPRFSALAEVTELQVTQIDTRERDRLSPYRVAATVNEFGKLELAGDVRLLSAEPTLTAKGSVSGIGLPPLSSYTVPAIGYNLTSGQLSAGIDFRFDEGVIDGALDLRLANIQVASAQNKKTQRTLRLLGSPLESALDTVRDSKNNVRLTLPVRGNLQDPRFDLSNVMGTAMVGAVQSAVLTYVKVSVLPLAALGTVLDVVGATTQIQLSPVEFVAGESTPREEGFDDYLTELAAVAGERPGLRFRLCGLATGADVAGADEDGTDRLLALAGERASLIKRRLIEDKGIAAERLFICQPQVVDDGSPPRVEVRVDK
ncbi:MAG: DUF748 domain-containing protein, partial [Pseudomonadota bacterium]|nr:DUF748 domain-containing protein [Pseudomonadota bacterium]